MILLAFSDTARSEGDPLYTRCTLFRSQLMDFPLALLPPVLVLAITRPISEGRVYTSLPSSTRGDQRMYSTSRASEPRHDDL